jgi:hypothetical protein
MSITFSEDDNTTFPLTTDMIETITQTQVGDVLSSRDLKKIKRFAKDLLHGTISLQIANGRLVAIDRTQRFIITE